MHTPQVFKDEDPREPLLKLRRRDLIRVGRHFGQPYDMNMSAQEMRLDIMRKELPWHEAFPEGVPDNSPFYGPTAPPPVLYQSEKHVDGHSAGQPSDTSHHLEAMRQAGVDPELIEQVRKQMTSGPDLEGMKRQELMKRGKEMGLAINSKMTKAKLVELIRGNLT